MSFEKEAITSPTQTSEPTEMRPERVVEPYNIRVPVQKISQTPPPALDAQGQGDVNNGDVKDGEAQKVRLSPQVAAVARKKRELFRQEQELKARKAQLDEQETSISSLRQMQEKLSAKDYSALDGLVDYNDYSQHQIDKFNQADPKEEKIKALSDKLDRMEKEQQDSTNRLFDAAVSERRTAINTLVDSNADFTMLKKLGLQEHVVQHILSTWENDSEELSVEQAALEVKEEVLRRKKLLDDASGVVQAQAEQEDVETGTGAKPLPPMKSMKTLTNQVSTDQATPKKSFRGLSDQDRWAEARRRAEAKMQTKAQTGRG